MAIGRINATLSGVQPGGLAKIVPTSVAVGSGSGSVDANGNVSFSGVSSISLNDAFSATYRNYRIVLNHTNSSEAGILMRLRVSGSDNSSANYGRVRFNNRAGSSGSTGGNTETAWLVNSGSNARKGNSVIDVSDTFTTENASYVSLGSSNNGTNTYGDFCAGNMSVTTSYTGFTFFPEATSTITGSLSIYGYN